MKYFKNFYLERNIKKPTCSINSAYKLLIIKDDSGLIV